jgi:hypothetical protein
MIRMSRPASAAGVHMHAYFCHVDGLPRSSIVRERSSSLSSSWKGRGGGTGEHGGGDNPPAAETRVNRITGSSGVVLTGERHPNEGGECLHA